MLKKYLLLFFFITSCAGVKMLSMQEIYSPGFLKKIESIQYIYKDGDKFGALQKLKELNNADLNPDEKAKKNNLIGVIYFSQLDYVQAIVHFDKAKETVDKDLNLASQIKLNLASTYYKRNEYEVSEKILETIELDYFKNSEKEKFYKLQLSIANVKNDSLDIVDALTFLGYKLESLSEVERYQYKDFLVDHFNNLSQLEKGKIFDRHKETSKYVVIYLLQLEIGQLYFSGKKDDARDLMAWMAKTFSGESSVVSFVTDFSKKMKNFSQINFNSVGLILPLSGEKARFGKQVLRGFNAAIKDGKVSEKITIFMKDNQGHSFLSSKLVEELILKEKVSVIIGGVFPSLAKKEFLEARKYGVYYISLSPVNLPRSMKNHLLLELPGSVESQIEKISSANFKKAFGDEMGMLYQKSESGHSYLNEVWTKSLNKELTLKNLNYFDKGVKEYLAPVKKLLNLSYPRERSEERDLWKEIYSVNKRQVRIVNYLKPTINFDWVFVPSYPHEAVQIIPTFQYYDAYNLTFIGGPSWSSSKLVSQKPSRSKLYFVGDDPSEFDENQLNIFKSVYNRSPNYLETLALDAMAVTKNIIKDNQFEKRERFENYVLDLSEVQGLSSKWNLKDGIWLKEMDVMAIRRSGIVKLKLDENNDTI